MKENEKYLRVGTTLYKMVRRPLISGDYVEENNSQQVQQAHNQNADNQQPYSGGNSGIASLLADLFAPNRYNLADEDNNILVTTQPSVLLF